MDNCSDICLLKCEPNGSQERRGSTGAIMGFLSLPDSVAVHRTLSQRAVGATGEVRQSPTLMGFIL